MEGRTNKALAGSPRLDSYGTRDPTIVLLFFPKFFFFMDGARIV